MDYIIFSLALMWGMFAVFYLYIVCLMVDSENDDRSD